MKRFITVVVGSAFLLALFHSDDAKAQPSIFGQLPHDDEELRASIERHSTRVETIAGAPEIPRSVAYRLFIEELLADANSDISATDAARLRESISTSSNELGNAHRVRLEQLCSEAEADEKTSEEIVALAERFDTLRFESEQELEAAFSKVLSGLISGDAERSETRWNEFRGRRMVVYTDFDMPGFARELPDAALRILRTGCTRFRKFTATP